MIEGLPFLVWPAFGQRLSILIYHRVLAVPDPLRPGEVDAASFDRQMHHLSQHCEVIPLLEAVSLLRQRKLPARACCITFDDGYADNLTVALPILEKYRLPATVFIATAYLDGGRMFNDTVIDLVAQVKGESLDLTNIGLGQLILDSVENRRNAVAMLLTKLRYLPLQDREKLVEQIKRLAGIYQPPSDTMLTTQQVRVLHERGVEIGGHTDAHTILTTLDSSASFAEIKRGKQRLEEIISKPIRAFAYPNGYPKRDYADEHVRMVRELGFEVAVTTAPGVANIDSDAYQLPRFTPWDKGMFKWSARLVKNAWLGQPAAIV